MNTTTDATATDQVTAPRPLGVYLEFGEAGSLAGAKMCTLWAMPDGAILLVAPDFDNPWAAPDPAKQAILPGITVAELSASAQRLEGGAS